MTTEGFGDLFPARYGKKRKESRGPRERTEREN